jgi:hypothetical protein
LSSIFANKLANSSDITAGPQFVEIRIGDLDFEKLALNG